MLYLTGSDGFRLLILETANLERIKEGKPLVTPDKKTLVAWTPDPVWLADRIADVKDGDAAEIARLIEEAANRPQKPTNRPKHETYLHKFLPEE